METTKTWNGNNAVFKTYLKGNGKVCLDPHKGVDFVKSFQEVQQFDSFGAVMNPGYIDISFDSDGISDKFWNMAKDNNWNCLILENLENGHIHSFWKIPKEWKWKDGKDKKLAVGLMADIHSGDTYIPLRVNGIDRFPPSYNPDCIQEVPEELYPVETSIDLFNLNEGDGRNSELFRYEMVLQSQLSFNVDLCRRILKNTNNFVFSDSLSDEEMDLILRDEAFEADIFYRDHKFVHNDFGNYMIANNHIKRINGQLHIYKDGIYIQGNKNIENAMLSILPGIKRNQRTEVLSYIDIKIPDNSPVRNCDNLIAFKNGILDIKSGLMLPFSPEYTITNIIPWDYLADAKESDIVNKTLNKITCNDPDIRRLLEECIGYCFFRKNSIGKSFILTGSGSNGKSTFLEVLKYILGTDNYSELDLYELGERFGTVNITGKLANIGDDISNDFVDGRTVAVFKKIVTGNGIKAEQKNEHQFFFKPYCKLLFSANEIPRMKSKGFQAIKRRLLIIPFNAVFSKDDPDYNPFIEDDLKDPEAVQYLIWLGVEGLKRVLQNKGFTESKKVREQVEDFEKENNPVLGWLDSLDDDTILFREDVQNLYGMYSYYCNQNNFRPLAITVFSKQVQSVKNFGTRRSVVKGIKRSFFTDLKNK